jgi:hypothetical protein
MFPDRPIGEIKAQRVDRERDFLTNEQLPPKQNEEYDKQ